MAVLDGYNPTVAVPKEPVGLLGSYSGRVTCRTSLTVTSLVMSQCS